MKVHKGQFDLANWKGVEEAESYRKLLYQELMRRTPAERYQFLVDNGWTRVDKVVVNGTKLDIGERRSFVRCDWRMPDARWGDGKRYAYRVFSQTDALYFQIWWNMQAAGLFRNDKTTNIVVQFS